MLTDKGATVAVVGENTLFRAGLATLVRAMELGEVQEAASLAALQRAAETDPSLIIIERGLGCDAVATVAEARRRFAGSRLVLISDDVELQAMSACFAAGLDGYLLKDIARDSLADSLRLVQQGEKVFPSRLASLMVDYSRRFAEPQISSDRIQASRLSKREAEILHCLVAGDSNKLIARKLEITESTVKVHLKSILRKTRAANRTQAAMWALQRGGQPHVAPLHLANL